MTSAVVGGGMLGLTLAWRLLGLGHKVDLFEASPWFGGLATSTDYGEFRWDRFYHCILPSDERLIGLLVELGLAKELRWKRTRTGYFGGGRFHEMTGGADFLRFPLLTFLEKARLGAALACATRFSDPQRLYSIPASEWLAKLCGKRTFEVFWRPLLRAKFGAYHDRVELPAREPHRLGPPKDRERPTRATDEHEDHQYMQREPQARGFDVVHHDVTHADPSMQEQTEKEEQRRDPHPALAEERFPRREIDRPRRSERAREDHRVQRHYDRGDALYQPIPHSVVRPDDDSLHHNSPEARIMVSARLTASTRPLVRRAVARSTPL